MEEPSRPEKKTFPVRWLLIFAGVAAAFLLVLAILTGGEAPPAGTEPIRLSSTPSSTQGTESNPTTPSTPEPSVTEPTATEPEQSVDDLYYETYKAYVQPPEGIRLCWQVDPYEDQEKYGYYCHLYLRTGGEVPGKDVCEEPVETFFATKDYLYYVKTSDPTRIYRTDWGLGGHEVVYTSNGGKLAFLCYVGMDTNGKLYAVVNEREIIEYDLLTSIEQVIMERYNISNAFVFTEYYYMKEYKSDVVYRNVIWWNGYIDEDVQFSGIYMLETGEQISGVRIDSESSRVH